MSQKQSYSDIKMRYRPYFIAVSMAILMTLFIAPEVHEGDAMEPTVSDGMVVCMTKPTFSSSDSFPKKGDVVVLNKDVIDYVDEDNPLRRVVATAGDNVRMSSSGEIFVNNELIATYSAQEGIQSSDQNIQDGEFFAICDNPEYAGESPNAIYGTFNTDDIRGTAVVIIWPLTQIGGIN